MKNTIFRAHVFLEHTIPRTHVVYNVKKLIVTHTYNHSQIKDAYLGWSKDTDHCMHSLKRSVESIKCRRSHPCRAIDPEKLPK